MLARHFFTLFCLTGSILVNHIMAADSTLAHRRGFLVISGKPGQAVRVKQRKHAFPFGTAIAAGLFGPGADPQNSRKYQDILKKYFNCAVHENALKWYATEKETGKLNYGPVDGSLAWCEKNGLAVRGHCLFWEVEKFVQDWIKKLDDDELRQRVEARAREVVSRYRGRIAEYDLNNEMIHGDFYTRRLGPDIVKRMALWAKAGDPDVILYVNDYDIINAGNDADKYIAHIKTLVEMGVPLGGIGCQAHYMTGKPDAQKMRTVLDKLAAFGIPVKITEFDIKTLDEELKAEALETMYRTCFAHPAVSGILLWGFWAGRHWLNSKNWGLEGFTALWDEEWNITPMGQKHIDLVYKEWWTDWEGTVGKDGTVKVPVFLGTHEVTVNGKVTPVEITEAGVKAAVK